MVKKGGKVSKDVYKNGWGEKRMERDLCGAYGAGRCQAGSGRMAESACTRLRRLPGSGTAVQNHLQMYPRFVRTGRSGAYSAREKRAIAGHCRSWSGRAGPRWRACAGRPYRPQEAMQVAHHVLSRAGARFFLLGSLVFSNLGIAKL